MQVDRVQLTRLVSLLSAVLLLGACEREAQISYSDNVRPILEEHCYGCHMEGGPGHQESGFKMASYEDLMKGTRYGPMINPGDSLTSNLYILVAGKADPSIKMPHGGATKLDRGEIDTIRIWIDQGAKNN